MSHGNTRLLCSYSRITSLKLINLREISMYSVNRKLSKLASSCLAQIQINQDVLQPEEGTSLGLKKICIYRLKRIKEDTHIARRY